MVSAACLDAFRHLQGAAEPCRVGSEPRQASADLPLFQPRRGRDAVRLPNRSESVGSATQRSGDGFPTRRRHHPHMPPGVSRRATQNPPSSTEGTGRYRMGRTLSQLVMADSEGFEPSRRFPAYTLSRRAPSTTRPTVRPGLILRLWRCVQGAFWTGRCFPGRVKDTCGSHTITAAGQGGGEVVRPA